MWTLRDPVPRLWPFFSLTALGGLVGWLIARRRALTDEEVALFLDARLAANQLMVSALPLAKTAGSSAAARVVVERADEVLGSASRRSLRPRLATPWLSMVPAGALLMWLASALEPRPAQVGDAPAVDVDAVREEQVPELERLLEAVAKITPADAEQSARLERLAARARALKEQIKSGTPRREALAELAELAAALEAEKLGVHGDQDRAGLEAALARLGDGGLERERRALAENDPRALDVSLERRANSASATERERIRQELTEAAKAARAEGAQDLARNLDLRAKAFETGARQAAELREISRALGAELPDAARTDLERLESTGDPEAERRLAEAMAKTLRGLSEQQRQRLNERLSQQASPQPGSLDPRALAELAQKLSQMSDRQIEEAMKKADADGAGTGAATQAALSAAVAEVQALKQRLGAGMGAGGQAAPSTAGSSVAAHGQTAPLLAPNGSLQVDAALLPGAPGSPAVTRRVPARPGETANAAGKGALGQAGPTELGAASDGDIPPEYRDQVGRYFQP